MITLNERKRALFEELLALGGVFVTFDQGDPATDLPPVYRERRGRMTLLVGCGAGECTRLDSQYLRTTLQFDGVPYRCRVPWRAVTSVGSEDGSGGATWALDYRDHIPNNVVRVDFRRREVLP